MLSWDYIDINLKKGFIVKLKNINFMKLKEGFNVEIDLFKFLSLFLFMLLAVEITANSRFWERSFF